MNSLFFKKILLAFVLGFLPVFILGLIDALDNFAKGGDIDLGLLWTTLLSLASGAVAVGLRAALAYFTNFMPSDALHGPGNKPTSMTVTRNS